MIRRQQRVSAALCFTTLLVVSGSVYAANANRPSWLSSTEPTITKTLDLPVNQEPMSKSTDCTPMQLPNGSDFINTCAYKTPPGTLAGGYLLDGSKGSLPYDPWYGGAVLPSVPNHPDKLLTTAVTRYGVMLRVGTYDATQLRYAEYYGPPTKRVYEYRGDTGPGLKDNSGRILSFWTNEVAYSANGDWLAGVAGANALIKYNINTGALWVISWDAASYSTNSGYQKTDSVAISDNGRYVAVTLTVPTNSGNRPALRVYDTQSCRDQSAYISEAAKHNSCEYKDLWSGEYRTGNTRGLREMVPGAEYPRRVRFVGDKTITFDTVYERTSATNFKVARYSVSMPQETTREYVGVIGMGDSYISGEGAAGTYFTGTDTKQNKCHLSWYSYPYRINVVEFQRGRSVACSGAKMLDVSMAAGDPETDPKKRIYNQGDYKGKDKRSWQDRLDDQKEAITNSFSPGYAQQIIFAREHKPRTVLLSIGGNDIGFKDILVSCIDIVLPDTCYQYYEDRLQLMEQILGQYDRLVKTYKSVLSESKGRVYVVGYPQIAKIDGSCKVNVRLNNDEIRFSNQLISYLNSVIKRAAAEAGAYYVDTESALNGHRLCEAAANQSGVNAIVNGDDIGLTKVAVSLGGRTGYLALGNESFHPTRLGHKLLAENVLAKTTNLTVAMPAPRPNNKPSIDYSSSLLKDAPHLPEKLRHREAIKWMNNDDAPTILLKQSTYTTNISSGSLKANTPIRITLRSEPATLYEGEYVPEDTTRFTIPNSMPAGFHTLDIYGTDSGGQPVDLRQVVYVAESIDDFDGDGLQNAVDKCATFHQSGTDEDADGIDDACDGEIRDVALDDPAPELPPQGSLSFDSEDTEDDGYTNGLLKLYVSPQVKPTEENNASQANNTSSTSPANTQQSSASGGAADQLNTALHLSGSLAPYYGYSLAPKAESTQIDADKAGSVPEVLGAAAQIIPQAANEGAPNKWHFAYVVPGVLGILVAALTVWQRAHRKRT